MLTAKRGCRDLQRPVCVYLQHKAADRKNAVHNNQEEKPNIVFLHLIYFTFSERFSGAVNYSSRQIVWLTEALVFNQK